MRFPFLWRGSAGYSITELAIVLAILGTLTALATPSFLTYYQASRLRVAAEDVAAFINQGRQLGIRQNVGVCVHINSTALQYRLGSNCDGANWVGTGTDASGNVHLPAGITLTTTARPAVQLTSAPPLGAARSP